MVDILILGAGPAGLTAGLYAARAGLKTQILEGLVPGGQAATTYEVANFPGFLSVGGGELSEKMLEQATAAGAELCYDEVREVRFSDGEKKLIGYSGEYTGRALIVATGAKKRTLGIPGEAELAGSGVSYCATCDGGFFKGREVAVVGGGNTALEDALYLSNLCRKVTLIHRRDSFRGQAVLSAQIAARENIEVLYSTRVLRAEGGGRLERLILQTPQGERALVADGLFVAVGTIPATELFRGLLPLDESGYLEAGEDTCTGVPGVFAAGDVRRRPIKQIVTACADGATAAQAALSYLQEAAQ